jgi:hypothetical protein
VLTGAGDDASVDGADIEYMSELSVAEAQEYAELGYRVTDAIEGFPTPVIAAVSDYVFGGGCELALAADLRVAFKGAVIGRTEVGLGIVPGWGRHSAALSGSRGSSAASEPGDWSSSASGSTPPRPVPVGWSGKSLPTRSPTTALEGWRRSWPHNPPCAQRGEGSAQPGA